MTNQTTILLFLSASQSFVFIMNPIVFSYSSGHLVYHCSIRLASPCPSPLASNGRPPPISWWVTISFALQVRPIRTQILCLWQCLVELLCLQITNRTKNEISCLMFAPFQTESPASFLPYFNELTLNPPYTTRFFPLQQRKTPPYKRQPHVQNLPTQKEPTQLMNCIRVMGPFTKNGLVSNP